MWNWSNGFLGFNEKRVWNVIPFVGFGWARSWGNSTHDNEIAANIGILNTFRLGKLSGPDSGRTANAGERVF